MWINPCPSISSISTWILDCIFKGLFCTALCCAVLKSLIMRHPLHNNSFYCNSKLLKEIVSHRGAILALCSWNKQAVWREGHNPCRVFELSCCDGSLILRVFQNVLVLAGFELMPCAWRSCGRLAHLGCISLTWLIDDHCKLFICFSSIPLRLDAALRA